MTEEQVRKIRKALIRSFFREPAERRPKPEGEPPIPVSEGTENQQTNEG